MYYVVKDESEIIASFPTILDARCYIEDNYPLWTDLGDYCYAIMTDTVYILEIYSE